MNDHHERWKRDNGDETLALEWAINDRAYVWEIGGFEGRWAAQIEEKFDPYITIFEPTRWGFGKCSARFFDNEKVDVRPYGLWVMDAKLPLYNPGNDGASLLMAHATTEVCQFKDAFLEVGALDGDIDLCLMNVEGSEYALLPYMIGYGLMKFFRYFWCQFHTFADPTGDRFLRIYDGMKQTHKPLWNYFPTAVAWERNGG